MNAEKNTDEDRDMRHSDVQELTPDKAHQDTDRHRALKILAAAFVLAVLSWGAAQIYYLYMTT